MNTEKEAILIVNEVLGYVHSKFIKEGSAFSLEFVDFRQKHNDAITALVQQRLERKNPLETIIMPRNLISELKEALEVIVNEYEYSLHNQGALWGIDIDRRQEIINENSVFVKAKNALANAEKYQVV